MIGERPSASLKKEKQRGQGARRRVNKTTYIIVCRNLRKEKQRIMRGVCIALLFLFFFSALIAFTSTSDARGGLTSPRIKYYTSVEIQKGECLWDLCSRYQSKEYVNIEEYIREVKCLNHLSTDKITEGAYLVLPYYSSKIKE